MKSFNIQPIKGTPTTLYSVSNQSFINPSNIGCQNLGNVTMDIYDSDNVYIGEAFIENLDLKIGPNFQQNIVSSANKTEKNQAAIEKMFSNWGMGIDQQFRAFGPTWASSGFYPLYNTSNQHFTVVGNKIPLIQNAYIGNQGLYPYQTIVNPTNKNITNSDMVFTARVLPLPNGNYISYNNTFYGLTCPSSSEGFLLGYQTIDGFFNESFVLPASGNINLTFSPLTTEYCLNWGPLAVCCGLLSGLYTGYQNSNNSFVVHVGGYVTITVEEFTFRQYYQQDVLLSCNFQYSTSYCPVFVKNICQVPGPGLTCDQVTALP
jgi:hypothetical protein